MLIALKADFIFRIPRNFSKVIDVLVEKGECDCLVEIAPDMKSLRLLFRTIPSGEKCVLPSSFVDESEMADIDLMKIYWLRWSGSEEGYKRQKVALELENSSGIGTEAILQEFWATVLTTNLFQVHSFGKNGHNVDTEANK